MVLQTDALFASNVVYEVNPFSVLSMKIAKKGTNNDERIR